jgi:GTP-binding protein Era
MPHRLNRGDTVMAYKAGYIAIIGKPNVGKSTLINSILDFKLSITSPRPQTTRRRIMGIMSGEKYQIIFLDTPGVIEPRYHLQKTMAAQIRSAVEDADALLYIIDDRALKQAEQDLLQEHIDILLQANVKNKPVFMAINKIDLVSKSEILPLIEWFSDHYSFKSIVPVSALKGEGLDQLREEFIRILPDHPPYYDPDVLTEQPERFFVAELIREQIFYHFKKEIPYSTEVQIEEFKEREEGKDYISAIIYTERNSQKAIIIGKKGSALKEIGRKSRLQIEKFLGRKVFLELHIKVKKDWRSDSLQIKRFGYS